MAHCRCRFGYVGTRSRRTIRYLALSECIPLSLIRIKTCEKKNQTKHTNTHRTCYLKILKMAKKNLKRKQKTQTEVVKKDESKVILPLVRRSDEPVTKKVWFFGFQIKFYFCTFSVNVDAHISRYGMCHIRTTKVLMKQSNLEKQLLTPILSVLED